MTTCDLRELPVGRNHGGALREASATLQLDEPAIHLDCCSPAPPSESVVPAQVAKQPESLVSWPLMLLGVWGAVRGAADRITRSGQNPLVDTMPLAQPWSRVLEPPSDLGEGAPTRSGLVTPGIADFPAPSGQR